MAAASATPAYFRAVEEISTNPAQREAFDADGNVVMLAGPGSGKTKTLTTKLARILLEELTEPHRIACVTFNNECVEEIQRRTDALGNFPSRRLYVGTLHGFCFAHILAPFGRFASEPMDLGQISVASDRQRENVLGEAMKRLRIGGRPEDHIYAFEKFRRTHVVDGTPPRNNTEGDFSALVCEYESVMHAKGLIDFDGMVQRSLDLVRSNSVVAQLLSARFSVLAIDEYQDLGVALHRLVEHLCIKGEIRLFAVGDPDQSIYGFTGARPRLLRTLAKSDKVHTVALTTNYRSVPSIADAARVMLGDAPTKGVRHGDTITQHEYPDGFGAQCIGVADELLPQLRRELGILPGDVAILYKDRHDGDSMAAALEAAGISYVRTDKGGPYPRNELTRWLERAAQWVTGGWRIREPRFEQILESWLRLLPRGGERDAVLERQQIAQFLWSSRDTKMSVVQWLDALEAQVNDHLARIRGSWPDLASGYDSLRNAVDSDGGALAGIDVVRLARAGGDPESVNLTTMHGSKGREFEAVVMIHMDQGHVPHWMAEPGTGGYRESRRLFYVGLTRAKQHVAFTWSGSGPISGAACFKMASLRF